MQTLFIGFVEDDVSPKLKGIAIRMAYLLSARLRLAGTIPNYYTLSEDLRTISFEYKMKFIDENMNNEPDSLQLYPRYKDFQKIYKKDRGNHKEFIVAKKKMEINVNGMFNILVDNIVAMVQKAGLADLKPIEDSSSYSEYYVVYRDAENNTEESNKLSEILTLNLDEEDNKNPTVFVLTDLFLSEKFNSGDNVMPALNAFSEKGFLQELFILPEYNSFSVADLNTVRFELKESLEHFQLAVNKFAKLYINPAEAFNYLQSDVVDAATTLEENINKTEIVTNYKNVPGAADVGKLYLGMVPYNRVLKYFEFVKVSQEETIEILNQIPADERNKFIPVLITVFNADTVLEETISLTQSQSLPLKKTLSID